MQVRSQINLTFLPFVIIKEAFYGEENFRTKLHDLIQTREVSNGNPRQMLYDRALL